MLCDFAGSILVTRDKEEAALEVAQRFLCAAVRSVAEHGSFSVAVPGGSSPRRAFEILSSPECSEHVPWAHTSFFFTDERCVPPEHPDSNWRQAEDMLFKNVPVSYTQLHRFRGELDPTQAAEDYEREMKSVLGEWPVLDLVLLGMGADTHTASLFPGSPAVSEQSRFAVSNYVDKLAATRLTLTYPALNLAREIVIMAVGPEKAPAVREALCTEPDPSLRPVQGIRPKQGRLIWVLDRQSAALLSEMT